MNADDLRGVTRLLVLQPTAFCNIDCDYCYLPSRTDRRIMPHDVVEAAIRLVLDHSLAAHDFTVVWHAGEPLMVPPDWYREAFRRIAAAAPPGRSIPHAVQTNGMLVDDVWCRLFAEHRVKVGVSIDGPAFLHDARRRTRSGKGTHAAALAGLRRLICAGIETHVICVVTNETLPHSRELIDFFHAQGVSDIGFNIEEVEGPNLTTSLARPGVVEDFRRFFAGLVEATEGRSPPIRIREVQSVLEVLWSPAFRTLASNSQNSPLAMLTVAAGGELFTFSPELAGLKHDRYGNFVIGRLPGARLDDVLASDSFQSQLADIAAGVAACRPCPYFDTCLGGAPVNKLSECGTFDATETLACKLAQQVVTEVVLTRLERRLDEVGAHSRS